MRESLPEFDAPHYDRPHATWLCGLTEEGRACLAGPTASGLCPALAECAPRRDGDGWVCNRSAQRGGPCETGPTPEGACACVHRCRPVRGLRAKRGRFVRAVATLAAGLLLVVLSANWRDEVLSPGPLSHHHGQLLAGHSAASAHDRHAAGCAMCHAATNQSFFGLLAMSTGAAQHVSQSSQCMNCHSATIPPEFAGTPHNLSPDLLRHVTAAAVDGADAAPRDQIACATCHREHQGTTFDITAIGNGACQACHQQRYDSFATDHPDFGQWPYQQRPPIAFDHVSHSQQHFSKKDQSFDCRVCHVSDATQTAELLAGYEAACATCHDEKIATSVAQGVPLLALPTLDVERLTEAGFTVGPWPEQATGDFDGRLPATMKLLLAADSDAAKAITSLGPDFDFYDVDPSDRDQLEACATIAASIRALLDDLNQRGPAAAGERLSAALGVSVSPSQAQRLLASLSQETLQDALAAWLPDAKTSTAPWPVSTVSAEHTSGPAFGPSGNWTHNQLTFTLDYHPAAHSDPLLASWLALLVETPELDSRPLPMAMLRELSKATAPGRCATCHRIERTRSAVGHNHLAIHWVAGNRAVRRSFTKFAHGPHLLTTQPENCTTCHTLGSSARSVTSSANWDAQDFVSEFQPMSKHTCATCHTAQTAGDRCQQCHHYHIETVEPWRASLPETDLIRHGSAGVR